MLIREKKPGAGSSDRLNGGFRSGCRPDLHTADLHTFT